MSLVAIVLVDSRTVLRNLDFKLSHLSESQRLDLEKLLLEFEHLFPDAPTRTDQIYHDAAPLEAKSKS